GAEGHFSLSRTQRRISGGTAMHVFAGGPGDPRAARGMNYEDTKPYFSSLRYSAALLSPKASATREMLPSYAFMHFRIIDFSISSSVIAPGSGRVVSRGCASLAAKSLTSSCRV